MATLKELLNRVLGQSAFVEQDTFFGQDPDNRQMVAFANRACHEAREFYPWGMLRKSTQIPLVNGRLTYDLPADFDFYLTETMWKSMGARDVVIPAGDRYWSFIKAGNPGTRVNYYAKFIQGKLEFTSVSGGDVINFDYQSKNAVRAADGTLKEEFTSDTDTYLLNESTLVIGTKAYWLLEKEIPAGERELANFDKTLKSDVSRDSPQKVIRTDRGFRRASPISADYLW